MTINTGSEHQAVINVISDDRRIARVAHYLHGDSAGSAGRAECGGAAELTEPGESGSGKPGLLEIAADGSYRLNSQEVPQWSLRDRLTAVFERRESEYCL